MERLGRLVVGLLAGLAIAAFVLGMRALLIPPGGQGEAPPPADAAVALSQQELDVLADAVAAAFRGEETLHGNLALPTLDRPLGPAYVALRAAGSDHAAAWGEGETALEGLLRAVETASAELSPDQRDEVDSVEIALTHSYRDEPIDGPGLTNVHRGVRGLELLGPNGVWRYSPTWMLATNRSFQRVIDLLAQDQGLRAANLAEVLRARTFAAEQVLVMLDDPPVAQPMFRGSQIVDLADVTQDSVAHSAQQMGDWLLRQVHEDGRMTYKYWPSRGAESSANNMIRQWMATVALGRLAEARDDEGVWETSRRNIAYNLEHFYEDESGLGLIWEEDKVKLGAVALAALALIEHEDRAEYGAVEAALRRTVDHLWLSSGRFRTWYAPPDRDDQHNFYPGEALYMWSKALQDGDEALLEQYMQSFAYYRDWHLDPDNRNPAFVPWHTQAHYQVWLLTRSPELEEFVFEMNDWLLAVQEWDEAGYRDVQGRFYDRDRPHFGPPHVSSTGVYLEGLIDAYRMARAVEDSDRTERYRVAIVRGLRSVMQQQFKDEVDLYYVAQRDRVEGGIRTNVYDNEIRVDNVQHNLMAALKILDTFEAEDFRVAAP